MAIVKIYPDPNFWLEPTSSGGTVPIYGASGIVTIANNIIAARNDNGEKLLKVDTDPTLAQDSDVYLASEKAVKAYIDNKVITTNDPLDMTFVTQTSSNAMATDILRIAGKSVTNGIKWILSNDLANISFDLDTTGSPIFNSSDGTFMISPTTNLTVSSPTSSTSQISGCAVFSGGIGVKEEIYARTLVTKSATDHLIFEHPLSSNIASVSMTNLGEMRIYATTSVTSESPFKTLNNTTSTSSSTGCAVFSGGVGIQDNLNVANAAQVGALLPVPYLVANDYIQSRTGAYLGKRINGGVWWRCYQLGIGVNDAIALSLITKDVDTTDVCLKRMSLSSTQGSATATFRHSVENGPSANQPRICAFASIANSETDEYNNPISVGGMGNDLVAWQSFTAITGKPLSSVTINAVISNFPWCADLYTGTGLGGTLLDTSAPTSISPSTFVFSTPVPLVAGNTYTLAFRPVSGPPVVYTITVTDPSGIPGGVMGFGGMTTLFAIQCVIRVMNTYDASWDVFIYGQPEVNSITNVTINASNNTPLWIDEGSGTWPVSHPLGADLRYDTNTELPNMAFELGSLKLNDGVQADGVTNGDLQIVGGATIGKILMSNGGIQMTNLVTKFDVDTALTADSAAYVPTQHAVKTYVDGRTLGVASAPLNFSTGTLTIKNNATSPAVVTTVDIDTTLAASSDIRIPTQNAVKSYVDTHSSGVTVSAPLDLTTGNITIKNNAASPATVTLVDVDTTLVSDSNTRIATQHAVKTYIDTKVPTFAWGSITIGTGNGPFNNVALSSTTATWFKINNSSNTGSHITGFAGGTDGRFIVLSLNTYPSSGTVTNIDHDSASSDAANRVLSPTGGSINLNPNPCTNISMIYDGSISRWVVIGIQP